MNYKVVFDIEDDNIFMKIIDQDSKETYFIETVTKEVLKVSEEFNEIFYSLRPIKKPLNNVQTIEGVINFKDALDKRKRQ